MAETDNVHAINDLLLGMPLTDRLSALACAIITDEPRAVHAVAHMIAVAGIMTRVLPPAQRLVIAWALLDEIEKIGAKWN